MMRSKQMIWCLLFTLFTTIQAIGLRGQDQSANTDPAAGVPAETEMDEGSTIEKASFLIGHNWISSLIKNEMDYDLDQILAGMKAADSGGELGMTEEEKTSVGRAFQQIANRKKMEKQKLASEKNGTEGKQAMEDFAAQEGAKELEDGIMYQVLAEGEGEMPEAPDRVRLHYKGTYVNGEVFDSSYERGEPIDNGVLQFVPGFSKALQSMKVGSKWKVIIRGDKAYGMRPRPPMEVNKTLVFEIELLEILDPQ